MLLRQLLAFSSLSVRVYVYVVYVREKVISKFLTKNQLTFLKLVQIMELCRQLWRSKEKLLILMAYLACNLRQLFSQILFITLRNPARSRTTRSRGLLGVYRYHTQ